MSIIRFEEPRVMPKTPPKGFALFAFGFRPFYLVGALLAAIGVPLWIAVLAGGIPLQPVFPAMLWHGHEMLFGFVAAIIVGFLLTAGHNWTGLSTPTGAPLAALVGLWLAGRLAMFSDSPVLAAALDLAQEVLADPDTAGGIVLADLLSFTGGADNRAECGVGVDG